MSKKNDSGKVSKFKQSADSIKMVIKDQAGEKMKGILEGVQNSFDAMSYKPKSEAIEIILEGDTLTISDTGKGFKKKDDFQIFGTDAKKRYWKKEK